MKNNVLSFLTVKDETCYMNFDSTIRQALEAFDYHKFTVIPLINDRGEYVTTLSEGDILRYIKNSCNFDVKVAESVRVSEIEKYRPYSALSINAPMDLVLQLALEQNFIPIKDDRGMFIGIIKRKDILKSQIEK